MELYVKLVRENYLEVIDIEFPQYVFVFDGIEVIEEGGSIGVLVNKASVVRSDAAEQSDSSKFVEDEEEFLSTHTELIIDELFRDRLEQMFS